MPSLWGNFAYTDWTGGNYTGPLTVGETGFINTTGAIFTPDGETGEVGVTTWLDSFTASSLTVVVSAHTPSPTSTAGWVGLCDTADAYIAGQSVDLSDGLEHTVVIDTSGVDWTAVKGLLVESGDTSIAHKFTLHSTSYTGGGGGSGTPVSGVASGSGASLLLPVGGATAEVQFSGTGASYLSIASATAASSRFAATGGSAFAISATGTASSHFIARGRFVGTPKTVPIQSTAFSVIGRTKGFTMSAGVVAAAEGTGESAFALSSSSIINTSFATTGVSTTIFTGGGAVASSASVSGESLLLPNGSYTTFDYATFAMLLESGQVYSINREQRITACV